MSIAQFVLAAFLLATGRRVLAQSDTPPPSYDFSLSREGRVRLSVSAAPPEVAGSATVYLLERTGYVKVRDGTNGFSCIVDRQHPLNRVRRETNSSPRPVLLRVVRIRIPFP